MIRRGVITTVGSQGSRLFFVLCLGILVLTHTPGAIAAGQDRVRVAAQPSAQVLLAHLAQAATMKGSAHIQGDINETVVKLDSRGREHLWMHIVSHGQTDESYHEIRNESYQTITSVSVEHGRTTTHQYETHVVSVGQTSASQSNGGAWTCQTSTSKRKAESLFNLGLGYPVRGPVNRGPTTVGGVPVWHVQGTITTSFYIATSKPVRADYYINRADGTLIQERATPVAEAFAGRVGQSARERARGTMTLTYSRWGKPLHISLPPACEAKS